MIVVIEGKRRGRRHLDGSTPGHGEYLVNKSISLRPADIAELEEIGDGNRSEAVRRLLALYRQLNPDTSQ